MCSKKLKVEALLRKYKGVRGKCMEVSRGRFFPPRISVFVPK
jgi:hypothetical protein